jgi:hypothetical protein
MNGPRLGGGVRLALLAAGLMAVPAARSQLAAPATLAPASAVGPDRVFLDWPASSGATTYNVKRALAAGGPHELLASTARTYHAGTTPTGGVRYFYAVTAVSNAAESASFREVAASPGLMVDNSDTGSVTATGGWPVSGLASVYGADCQYAATNWAGSWGGADLVSETGTGTPVDVRIEHLGDSNRFLRLRAVAP